PPDLRGCAIVRARSLCSHRIAQDLPVVRLRLIDQADRIVEHTQRRDAGLAWRIAWLTARTGGARHQNQGRTTRAPKTCVHAGLRPLASITADELDLWIGDRLAPRGAADVGLGPAWIGRIEAVDVALALGIRITILETPVEQRPVVGILLNRCLEHRALAVVHHTARTAAVRCLAGPRPRQDAVGVSGRLP